MGFSTVVHARADRIARMNVEVVTACPTCGGALNPRSPTQVGQMEREKPERVQCAQNAEHLFGVVEADETSGGQARYRIIVPD